MESSESYHPEIVISFLFSGLLLGAITYHFLNTIGNNIVPYTVVIFFEVAPHMSTDILII